jgi:hypothetical protein
MSKHLLLSIVALMAASSALAELNDITNDGSTEMHSSHQDDPSNEAKNSPPPSPAGSDNSVGHAPMVKFKAKPEMLYESPSESTERQKAGH